LSARPLEGTLIIPTEDVGFRFAGLFAPLFARREQVAVPIIVAATRAGVGEALKPHLAAAHATPDGRRIDGRVVLLHAFAHHGPAVRVREALRVVLATCVCHFGQEIAFGIALEREAATGFVRIVVIKIIINDDFAGGFGNDFHPYYIWDCRGLENPAVSPFGGD